MAWEPPIGERRVRVLRTEHHARPVCHPTNPTLDSWDSWDSSSIKFVRESQINPATDTRLDL